MATHAICRAASIVVFLLSFGTGFSIIVNAPSSKEIQLGGSTYFNCSTSATAKEIHWFHYPMSTTERSFVYGYNQFYSRYLGGFAIDKNATTGVYNLLIASIVAEDAGKYECQDNAGSGSKASANLIILETDLTCQSNVNVQRVVGPNACGIEPDQLILTCTAQYNGNEAPILQWGLNDTGKPLTKGVTGQVTGNRVFYNLTMKTDEISNGSFYQCRTTRSTTKISCKSGNIKVVESSVEYPTYVASDYCQTYVNPYKAAVIFLILLLPISIIGTVFVLWYLRIYRPRHPRKDKKTNLRDCMSCISKSNSETVEPPKDENAHSQPLTSESEQKSTDAAAVNQPLISNEPEESKKGINEAHQKFEKEENDLNQQLQLRDQTIKENNNTITELTNKVDMKEETIASLHSEIDDLQRQVKDLERRLYRTENIEDKPELAYTIELSENNKGKSISGITVLGTELFVVTKGSQEMEVFDSKTFKYDRCDMMEKVTNPLDIASSQSIKCLYVIEQGSTVPESQVMRIDPRGKLQHCWSTSGGIGRLSTCGSNVIICLSHEKLILEYSPDGELIAKVPLSPANSLNNPQHAIRVTSECFIVSHGDFKDELHRVCVVDLAGSIKMECKSWEKQHAKSNTTMKVPICLLVDDKGSIIVADTDRKRILLLNSMLQYQRKVVDEKSGLKDYPFRLCFNGAQSNLFVVVNKWNSKQKEWNDGRIQIFNIKKNN